LKIVFQNEHFIVIDKPHGMLTVPARTGDADPRECAGKILERQTGSQIFPVHRLDFEVGGLVIFAVNATAHREASRWFEHHLVQKRYEAIATRHDSATFIEEVTPQNTPLVWEAMLVRGKKRAFEAPHGKKSLTRAWFAGELPAAGPRAELWRLEPVTGRSHQLRWEMQRHGRPILGDTLYGGDPLPRQNAIVLRAVQILFSSEADVARFGLPREGFACEPVESWFRG
jgi:tRNA pseudouridine32 synthase/23S rRNA pseudouridine746 synthase